MLDKFFQIFFKSWVNWSVWKEKLYFSALTLTSFSFSSLDSEYLVSTSTDGSARIWKTEDGFPLTTLTRNSVCLFNWILAVWRLIYLLSWYLIACSFAAGWKDSIVSIFQGWDKTISVLHCSKRFFTLF